MIAAGGMDTLRLTFSAAQRRRLIALAVVTGAIFLVLGAGVHTSLVSSIDLHAQQFVQSERVPAFDRLMQFVTRLGSGWVLLPVTGVVCAALTVWHRRLAIIFVVTAISAVALEAAAKGLVGRGRPNTYAWGYPSAHVFGLVAFLGMAVYALWALGVTTRRCAGVGVAAALIVTAVAISRLWVNAHWLSDVVGGVVGGTALVLTIAIAIDAHARLRQL
jgi:membrane-associated phospholipid phosphatase